MKVLDYDKQKQNNDKQFTDLKRELSILSKLSHPNIIKYYDCVKTKKALHIFMELA